MGNYITTNNSDRDGIVSIIKPQKEIPVVYIDLLDGKSGKVGTLRLTENDNALIDTYLKNFSKRDEIDTKRLIEFSSGEISIYDMSTPELIELSELPHGAVKRKGFVREATVRTFPEFTGSNKTHTQVHYDVVDEYGGEVNPIIINGSLIVPECVATADIFSESTEQHGIYRTGILRQLKSFEKESEPIFHTSS